MAIMDEEWVEHVNVIATSEANKLASRFSMLDRDEIHNELWLWIFHNQDKVNELVEADEMSTLAFYLRTEGRRFCLTEKARISGFAVEDLHFYTSQQLYDLLPTVFSYRDWQPSGLTGEPGMPRSQPDPKFSGNLVAMLADVSAGLLKLHASDYNVIIWRFKYDHSDEQLALELDCTPEAANKRVQRAVRRLCDALGGKTPFGDYTGSRKAQSNAAARAHQQRQWDGE